MILYGIVYNDGLVGCDVRHGGVGDIVHEGRSTRAVQSSAHSCRPLPTFACACACAVTTHDGQTVQARRSKIMRCDTPPGGTGKETDSVYTVECSQQCASCSVRRFGFAELLRDVYQCCLGCPCNRQPLCHRRTFSSGGETQLVATTRALIPRSAGHCTFWSLGYAAVLWMIMPPQVWFHPLQGFGPIAGRVDESLKDTVPAETRTEAPSKANASAHRRDCPEL